VTRITLTSGVGVEEVVREDDDCRYAGCCWDHLAGSACACTQIDASEPATRLN
jgi:hypothetical protein